jgi:hypothetical protein
MAEIGSVDGERLEHVRRIVEAMYLGLVQQVIAQIKALPDSCRQSGDDSRLKDVWEEFKDQVQGQESIFFRAYEDTIQRLCAKLVAAFDRERQGLLWLWSNAWYRSRPRTVCRGTARCSRAWRTRRIVGSPASPATSRWPMS